MPLYEFALEIQNGDSSYEHKEWVLAANDDLAMRHAREVALNFQPRAEYDPENDVYSASGGWRQWTLARCTPVTLFTVPIAGKKRSAQVVPVLWDEAFPQGLRRAADILRALTDPSLAGCSLALILSDYLELTSRALADVVRVIGLLEESLPESVPALGTAESKVPA